MGWTKDEVDKYVAKIERNTRDPSEKNLKGYAFARLYREAKDNNKAKRHLEAYLSVNETDYRGHRMMGQLFEETGNLSKALLSYRRSLDLNNTQHDLVLKVVELYCQVPVDPGVARAWADRAARLYPGHTAVFKLRMHLLESAGRIDYDQMEDLITDELAKRPRDVELHIRLVKIYATTGRLIDAISHCVSVIKTKAFNDNQEWWRCTIDVFEKYMAAQDKKIPPDRDISPGHVILDLHAHLLGALSQLLSLFLKTETIRECKNAFYRLDYCLNVAHERKFRQIPQANHRTEWEVALIEMKGQLYQHCGTLILRLANENYLTWPRALKLASVCYLASTQIAEPDINTPWVATAPKNKDALRWYRMACHRLSHSGHILGGVANKYGEDWLDECISDWCTQQGQDEIINTVYNQQQDLSKSFLANDDDFFLLELNIPSPDQLLKYDEVCVGENPRNLQLIIWIGLHWHQFEGRIRPGVGVMVTRIFEGLRMDAHNMEQTAAETMCLRDLEAFLYAVIRTSAAKHLEDLDVYRPDYQPQILPQQLCATLSSQPQEKWWIAAYNLYTGAASVGHSGKVRATVQRGLEVIRALGSHGMHVRLLIFLAFNFGDKASYLKASGASPWHYEEHWKSLQARSQHYWKEVLVLLDKIERNENIPVRKDPLFEPLPNNLKKVDIKFNIQKARLILGEAAFKEGRIEDAMEMFEQVKTIQGMWNLAQIYKYLANVEAQAAATDDLGSEAHSSSPAQEYYNCLNRARDLLMACMEKVGTEERQRQNLQDELNDIEDRLNEDPNKTQKNTRKQLDFRQLDFQASRSSTTMSDVQESEDNFWLDQPQDGSSKDLIAKLSEVTLNNGYLQEQMAMRDQYVLDLTSKVDNLESELRELKMRQFSGMMSPASTSLQHANVTPRATPTSIASSSAYGTNTPSNISITPTSSLQQTSQNGFPTESTPVAKPSVKSRLGPRIQPVPQAHLPKIEANFFAGLSDSNSPEKRKEQEKNEEKEVEEDDDEESEQGSPRHSTSCDDGIHFEPLIPLPKKIEKKTGEEGEKVLFTKRAKLYRFVKDDKAWKERGHGIMKILSSEDSSKFRILMRRDHTLKICANHLITTDMEIKPGAGAGNSLVWTTHADYTDEVPKVEQLAVRFKLLEDATEFQEVFDSCKAKLSGVPEDSQQIVSPKSTFWECSNCSKENTSSTSVCATCGLPKLTSNTKFPIRNVDGPTISPKSTSATQSLIAKFAPKTGSWECSHCLINNQPSASACEACGQANPSTKNTEAASKMESTFAFGKEQTSGLKPTISTRQPVFGGSSTSSFGSQIGAFTTPTSQDTSAEQESKANVSFDYKPQPSPEKETENAKPNKSVFAVQPAAPFSFTPTSGSPLKFSFGPTQAPSSSAKSSTSEPTSAQPPFAFPTLFDALTAPKSTEKTTSDAALQEFSFGSPNSNTKANQSQDKPLTFSSSPNAGFGLSDDEDDNGKDKPGVASDQVTPKSTKDLPSELLGTSQKSEPPSVSATTIMPQLFWQQQLEEKFKFGNLHKTQPLAGMAPVVSPNSGKGEVTYPASLVLSQMAGKSPTRSQTKPLTGSTQSFPQMSQKDEELISFLQGKLKGSSLPEQFQLDKWTLQSSTAATLGDEDEYDDYSDDDDDDYETESEDTESYASSEDDYEEDEYKLTKPQRSSLLQQLTAPNETSGRKVLTARSSLKKEQYTDDECVFLYQVDAVKSDRDKAAQLLLPLNFFNYTALELCKGCLGCEGSKRLALTQKKEDQHAISTPIPSTEVNKDKNKQSFSIFGNAGQNELSFSSFASSSSWATSKNDSPQSAFPKAGQQLFSSAENEEFDLSEEVGIHFKPLISLPDIIETKSGEDEYTLLFSERARLYRFDAPSSMWKERGIGDIKLLLDDQTERGRVVMRRDQVRKLCANHWITQEMELVSNSTSDRSWVWQTLSDLSEEVPSQEKLAVRFKSQETAKKFKEIFNDLIAKAKCAPTTAEAKKPIQLPCVTEKPDTWNCDACYCPNAVKDTNCIACGAENPEIEENKSRENITSKETKNDEAASKPDEKPIPKLITSGFGCKPVFTIGRENAPEEELEKADYLSSPSKTSPSKSPVKPSSHPVAVFSSTQDEPFFGFGMGSMATGKFNFKLELKPDDGKTTQTPTKSPVKSPQSPQSPGSPGAHPETEDHRIHFEPVISLPKLVSKTTGEESEETHFCHRAKVYRFETEEKQWKERGVGEIKILTNKKSGKSRLLMRRDNVLKICVNHQITPEMDLQHQTEKSWIWNTPADFADEIPKPETLAIRFKNSEIAMSFKDAFDKAKEVNADNYLTPKETAPQNVDDKAKEGSSKDQATDEMSKTTPIKSLKEVSKESANKQDTSPSKGYLFGSPSISSLSFASVAATLKSSPEKDEAFQDTGPQLSIVSPSPRKESESEVHHDNDPHFEPIIALPEKIKVTTGEEEEDVVFSHRAKLYRFEKDSKQWKERGLGDIKILYHDKNSRARILMRRDQIHKICANHYITPEMTLSLNGSSQKSWVWNTLADFSDEEVKAEQLAVRFKLEATAEEFKKRFEECKEKVVQKQSPEKKKDDSAEKLDSVPTINVSTSLMDKFKPQQGTWECDVCCIPNEPTSTACVACQTPKPGSIATQLTESSLNQSKFQFGAPLKPPQTTGFKFNFVKSLGTESKVESSSSTADSASSLADKFKPAEGCWECDACLVQNKPETTTCIACQSRRPHSDSSQTTMPSSTFESPQPTGFSFGSSKPDTQTKPAFGFGAPNATGFTFGSTDSVSQSKQVSVFGEPTPTGFTFGSSDSNSQSKSTGVFGVSKPIVTFGSASSVSKSESPPANIPQFIFGKNQKSASLPDTAGNKPNQTKEESEKSINGNDVDKGKEGLMEKFQPKQGAWECDICLIQNKAGTTKCAACQTPKPGSDAQESSCALPAFNFGGTKPISFALDTSKSDKPFSPFSFSSGFPFGTKTSDTTSNQFVVATGSEESKPTLLFGDSKLAGFSFASNENDNKESTSTLFQPQFNIKPSSSGTTSVDGKPETIISKTSNVVTKSLDLPELPKVDADSTGSPEIEEIYSSIFPNTTSQQRNEPIASERRPDDSDPTITTVVEPSDEEKDRAKSLLLPEGFFLYDRKSTTSKGDLPKTTKPEGNVPEAKQVEQKKVVKESPQKAVFESFSASSFDLPKTTKPEENVPEAKQVEQKKVVKESPQKAVFGSFSASSFASFSDMSSSQAFQFGNSKSQGFAGQGSQLFSTNKDDDGHPSAECDVHFEPIVNLPQVEVENGEEKEEKIFSHRAKLYRFDQATSQWKERGVGDIKILKLKDVNKYRVVMRRYQIHKLCANHIIIKDMKLVPSSSSDRTWVWNTLADLSEEEPAPQQFAVRFKTCDIADEFKKAFEECQQTISDKSVDDWPSEQSSEVEDDVDGENQEQPSSTSKDIGKKLSFAGERLTKTATPNLTVSAGESWECQSCYTPNLKTQPKCVACGDSHHADAEPSTQNIKEDAYPTSDKTQEIPDSSSANESTPVEKPKTGFLFEAVSALSFSDAAQSNLFGGASSSEPFSFNGLNDPKPKQDTKENEDHDGGYHNVSGDHIHFEPIIPLPEKVEVVTGEEHQEILFKERAKLYRFDKDTKQWKERGVGEFKILSKDGRTRIVMRRDHIHKLCANHAILPDMVLTPNGNRSWVWQTFADFSDGEQKAEQLAIRFKTTEIASAFKKTFEECTAGEIPSSTTQCEDNTEDSSQPLSSEADSPSVTPDDSIQDVKTENQANAIVPKPEGVQTISSLSPLQSQFFTSTQTSTNTSTIKVEKTVSAKMHQETKVEQSGGIQTEETKTAAFSVQDESISSSTGTSKPFQFTLPGEITPSPPSIFNQQLLFQKGRGLSAGAPFGQTTWPSPLIKPQFPSFGSPIGIGDTDKMTELTTSAQQLTSKHSEMKIEDGKGNVVEEKKVVQTMEARKVETLNIVSSSSDKSAEIQPVSCSPEITRMLQELQESDQK